MNNNYKIGVDVGIKNSYSYRNMWTDRFEGGCRVKGFINYKWLALSLKKVNEKCYFDIQMSIDIKNIEIWYVRPLVDYIFDICKKDDYIGNLSQSTICFQKTIESIDIIKDFGMSLLER